MTESVYYQLPAVMPVPHRPEGSISRLESMDEEALQRWGGEVYEAIQDLLRWSKEMHSSIYDNYIPQTDRIENMVMVDEDISKRPAPIGSRRFFYHRPNRKLFLDVRVDDENFWDLVFSEEALTIVLDTSNFNKILGPTDSDLQQAMDTLDDHIHAAEEITVNTAGFTGILGVTDDEVQHALDTIDIHSHYLGDLLDVLISGPANGQVLAYNLAETRWENQTLPGIPTIDYDYVSDNDPATDVTAAELEELTDGSETSLHTHSNPLPSSPTVVNVTYYEAGSDDWYILVIIEDDAEVVLPDAAANDGREIHIKRTSDNQYDVEVSVAGGGLIEGVGSFFLQHKYDAITCVSINSAWWIF